jgi:hypothetical protein
MNRNVTLTRTVKNNGPPNRLCEKNMIYTDICQISELTDVLTPVVAKPIASLIVAYSFENSHQRFGMRLLNEKYLSDEARNVLREYSGLSWVAESVIGHIPEEIGIGVNINPAARKMFGYNTTEHGCTYSRFYELLIVHIDVHSNSLFLDCMHKYDETDGIHIIHKYEKPEISIPLVHLQDISLSGLRGFCACGGTTHYSFIFF